MCPSFTFGTDGVHGPCVLASPLEQMVHAVCVSYLCLWDQWCTRSVCPCFTFRTDGLVVCVS